MPEYGDLRVAAKAAVPEEENPQGRCWILANADGSEWDDGGDWPQRHFRTAADARGDGPEAADTPAPSLLDGDCQTLACAACEYVADEDEGGIVHFFAQAEAEQWALGAGWRVRDGEPVCPCDGDETAEVSTNA